MAKPTTVKPVAATPAANKGTIKSQAPVKATVVQEAPKAASETKATRIKRATREACAETRKELPNDAKLAMGKTYEGRDGLRKQIVLGIQASATVWDAVKREVKDPTPGKKHSDTPYRIKKVDVGFALSNGYVTLA